VRLNRACRASRVVRGASRDGGGWRAGADRAQQRHENQDDPNPRHANPPACPHQWPISSRRAGHRARNRSGLPSQSSVAAGAHLALIS